MRMGNRKVSSLTFGTSGFAVRNRKAYKLKFILIN